MGVSAIASLDRAVIGGPGRTDYRSAASLSHCSSFYTGAAVTGLERLERRAAIAKPEQAVTNIFLSVLIMQAAIVGPPPKDRVNIGM